MACFLLWSFAVGAHDSHAKALSALAVCLTLWWLSPLLLRQTRPVQLSLSLWFVLLCDNSRLYYRDRPDLFNFLSYRGSFSQPCDNPHLCWRDRPDLSGQGIIFLSHHWLKRVRGCQSTKQLEPIRTSQIIIRAKSLKNGCHVWPTS